MRWPDPPEGYIRVAVGGAAVMVVASAAEVIRAALAEAGTLDAFARRRAVAVLAGGRGPAYVLDAEDRRWVVRRYRRGGAMRPLGDRYVRVGEPRPIAELRVSAALRARGVPTPPVVAAAVYPAGIWYRGDLVTRQVPDAVDLAALVLADTSSPGAARPAPDRVRRAARAAGAAIRALHDAGALHPDLNLRNILVRTEPAPAAFLVDLDRCRLRGTLPESERRAMLARFWRSVRKLSVAAGRTLPAAFEPAFEAGYAEGVG